MAVPIPTVHETTRCRSTPERLGRLRRSGLIVALVLTLLPVAITRAQTPPVAAYPDPPQALFKDLFIAVQTTPLFADGKAFPDAVPNAAPDDILVQYHASHPDSPQELKRFIE